VGHVVVLGFFVGSSTDLQRRRPNIAGPLLGFCLKVPPDRGQYVSMGARAISRAGAALVVLAFAPAIGARTGPCAPVVVASDRASLPPAWRDALDALVQATAREGMPWSCPGGSVELTLDAASGGGVITLVDARGRSVSRPVATPADLLATGEALLAAPLEDRAPPPAPAPPVSTDRVEGRAATPSTANPVVAPPRDPRVQIQALLGPRVSGPGPMGWMGGKAGVLLPWGPWSLGLWARLDYVVGGPPRAPSGFSMNEVCVGLALGRRLLNGPLELRVSLDPSVADPGMEAGEEDMAHPEGSRVAFRIGTTLTGTFRIAGVFRGIVTLDGELTPAGLAGLQRIPPENGITLPPMPVYTAGLLLGVEAIIR
jgi:hypothetical protein